MSDDEEFERLVSGIKTNWPARQKVFETLRTMNYTTWYLHELIDTLDDPEEEVEEHILNLVDIVEETCQNLIDTIEDEYELDDE